MDGLQIRQSFLRFVASYGLRELVEEAFNDQTDQFSAVMVSFEKRFVKKN